MSISKAHQFSKSSKNVFLVLILIYIFCHPLNQMHDSKVDISMLLQHMTKCSSKVRQAIDVLGYMTIAKAILLDWTPFLMFSRLLDTSQTSLFPHVVLFGPLIFAFDTTITKMEGVWKVALHIWFIYTLCIPIHMIN